MHHCSDWCKLQHQSCNVLELAYWDATPVAVAVVGGHNMDMVGWVLLGQHRPCRASVVGTLESRDSLHMPVGSF